MKQRSAIVIVVLFCYSCHEPAGVLFSLPTPQPRSQQADTIWFIFSDTFDIQKKTPSYLLEKASRLKKLDQPFRIQKLGTITKESSIVYKAIKARPESCFSSGYCCVLKDIDALKESISSIRYAKVKSTLDSESAIIEEILFYNAIDAKTLLSYINHVRRVEYFWESLDKKPSTMFREGSALYYIRNGNKYGVNTQIILAEAIMN